jgi:hypothetical protein
MNKRLIIDSQLAAQDPASVFSGDWSWPVSQPEYDDPITEFIEWSDELHKEISDSSRLLSAFLLIKSDLLKDLSYYTSAWVDIASAKRTDTEVVFNSNQYIFESIVSNEFKDQLPTEIHRKPAISGIRGRLRTRLSRFKRARTSANSLRQSNFNCFAIGTNALGVQIAPVGTQPLRLTNDDLQRNRTRSANVPDRIRETAAQISDAVIRAISHQTESPTTEFTEHVNFITNYYLRKGWIDAGDTPNFTPKKAESTLVTGTGSGYSARLLASQFMSEGHRVVRTTHGGDAPLFDDVLWPSIDLPFASTYVAHGKTGTESLATTISQRSESQIPNYAATVVGAGSDLHARIREAAKTPTGQPVKNVSVITASFTGMHRVTPHMKLHDVVYMEWHRRLLQDIRNLGFRVISKRHPKGLIPEQAIFSNVVDEELLKTPMAAIEQQTDAYVIDFLSSALMEAICTLKPVVLIDIPVRMMRPEARTLLSKSVEVIPATFDDRNRVVIDEESLRTSLEKPVNLDAREQLIQEYLLSPSADIGSIFE